MPRVGKDKHKAELCNLYIRVKEEGDRYIADFFTEDDMFIQTWAVSKDSTSFEDFLTACEAVAIFIDTGKW
jgi:hypothetical protein